jgi:methionyl aminopeptidase
MAGIAAVKDGEKVLAVATAISGVLRSRGYEPIDGMSGHGVGVRLHEPPQVPNRIEGWDCSAVMRRGMTLAIEPMVGLGSPKARFRSDGWTVVMSDGLPSAHFEHTVLVTDGQAEVLTVV